LTTFQPHCNSTCLFKHGYIQNWHLELHCTPAHKQWQLL
jgi:hypothetical protein